MPDSDNDVVTFEVGRSEDETEWRLTVKCPSGLTDEEFAVALQSLADDILKKQVSFDTAENVEDSDFH